jgi:hypothetical protein
MKLNRRNCFYGYCYYHCYYYYNCLVLSPVCFFVFLFLSLTRAYFTVGLWENFNKILYCSSAISLQIELVVFSTFINVSLVI